jgi:hypothetical protein
MGGTKGQGAFAKNMEDLATLLKKFMQGILNINAEPSDVTESFPNLEGKTAGLILSGFNCFRDLAWESLSAMAGGEGGRIIFFK